MSDENDLARFGYTQELERSLGKFSSFAAGFSYLSILTGMFQMFYLGYGAGGPAFLWTWPAVFVGQFLVALGFAELAAHYPLSGGVYQWSKRVGTPSVGWMAGWVYLACLVVTLAAVPLALQGTLPQIHPAFQLIGDAANARDAAANACLLGCLLIAFSTVINSIGVRWLARINNIGVFAELAGIAVLVFLLALRAKRGPAAFAFVTQGRGAGEPLGYAGPFLAAAALTASYVMYGYDTAGTLAEETREPRRNAPRAILQALAAAAAAGFLILLFAMMAASDLGAPELSLVSGGLSFIVKDVLGDTMGRLFLMDVAFAITVCALAVHTGAVRLVFAMARDGGLPCSPVLARVSPDSRTPIVPVLLVGIAAAVILVVNIDFPKVIELVTGISILWANLAYLLVTAPLFARRLKGWPEEKGPGLFSLGRWGLPVNGLATAWCVFTVLNVGWPRSAVYGEAWQHRFSPVLFTALLVASGAVYLRVRGKHVRPLLRPGRS